ncbi:MAG TPA: serine/threonine-protein kinase [Polyangiaceae bacterium]|jgi:serine/threonine-protein kinase|nr:serine/threonine-protein kinase [Polyangiaceae bacterium]
MLETGAFGSANPGQVVDGRYKTVGIVGRGGMSEVVHCVDLETGDHVALKGLAGSYRSSEDHRRRLRREADIAAAINHPNVAQILRVGNTPEGDPYLVMELLVGETLADLIAREGALTPARALPLVRQAAAGLDAMHSQGIIHRDVKPNNLFLCGPLGEPNCLKLFDFGFARHRRRKLSQGQVLGTLEYMAPEQVVSEPADVRSDIYSLGMVMYRCLTRELPFDHASQKDMLAHQLISAPPPPSWLISGLDPRIETVILTAIRKNPANRYGAMSELLLDIDRVLSGEAVTGAPLVQEPDRYEPQTDLGQRALRIFTRRQDPNYNSTAPPPVRRWGTGQS